MSIFEALILGFIQGATEFLPVSSSGHLTLTQMLFGFGDIKDFITFNVILHAATLLAILIYFSNDIKDLFLKNKAKLLCVMIATAPLFPAAVFIKPLKKLMQNPNVIGFSFLITALFLFLGDRAKKKLDNSSSSSSSDSSNN